MIYILSGTNKYSHFICQMVYPSFWFKKRKTQLGIITQVRGVLSGEKLHSTKKTVRQIYFSVVLRGPGVNGLTLTSGQRFEPLVEEKLMA